MIHILHLLSNYKKSVRSIMFSHYLDHSAPLLIQLDILNFKALVTQQILLLMYKIHMENDPLPNSNVFIYIYIYKIHHNYNTRQKKIYILKLGRTKTVINISVFMVLIFGITFEQKFQ